MTPRPTQKEQRQGRDNVPCKKSSEREETPSHAKRAEKGRRQHRTSKSLNMFPLSCILCTFLYIEGLPISGSCYYLLILHRDNIVQCDIHLRSFAAICIFPRLIFFHEAPNKQICRCWLLSCTMVFSLKGINID